MTAKFLNKYPVRNAIRVIEQNRKFAIILSILFLLGAPLTMGSLLSEVYREAWENAHDVPYSGMYDAVGAYAVIGVCCASVAVALGIVCGVRAFEDEWNKSRVDMLYALPLNGTERFFSNYIGGLVMYLVPYIVSTLISWIILLIMMPMIENLSPESFTEEFGMELPRLYLYYFLGTFGLGLLMWMYYTITAISASCCGTLFENIYTSILLNLLIPGTFAAVLGVITAHVEGLEFEYSWHFMGYMSPIGGLIYLVYMISELVIDQSSSIWYYGEYTGGEFTQKGLIPAYVRWAITVIIITAALLVLAWKLYQYRKAEHVGKPFVYSWIYHLVITAITVCILCISSAEDDFLPAVILFSAIVYFIMEVVRKRGFKKFWKSIITYALTVILSIGLYVLTIATECFGRVNYVPPVSMITAAELQFSDRNMDNQDFVLSYTDKETIQKITEFHQHYLENHDTLEEQIDTAGEEFPFILNYYYDASNPYGNYSYETYDKNAAINSYSEYEYYEEYTTPSMEIPEYQISLMYHTIAGTSIYREYSLYPDEYAEFLNVYLGTEAYAEAGSQYMVRTLQQALTHYNEQTHRSEMNQNTLTVSDNRSQSNNTQTLKLPDAKENYLQLAEAYRKDLETFDFNHCFHDVICCYVEGVPVYDSFSETLTLLEKWGFKAIDQSGIILSEYTEETLEVQIYAPENYFTGALQYPTFRMNVGNHTMLFREGRADYQDVFINTDDIATYYPEFGKLLDCARKQYISSEPCYLMIINGNGYFIPEKFSSYAEALIQKGYNYYRDNLFFTKPNATF